MTRKSRREAERDIEAAQRSGAKVLDLRNIGLAELPESLGQLTQLRALLLGHNQLKMLPESLVLLTNLDTLDINNNQLTALPESLGNLTHLQSLNLLNNQLTALPKSLQGLTELDNLDISENLLTSLPECLGSLTQLRSLFLRKNQLTVLPEWLGELTRLSVLDVGSNHLTTLPESLVRLSHLQSLDLQYNQLTALPEWVGRFTQLHSLSLGNNRLAVLPESLGQLTKLLSLYLGYNQLKTLPESLGQLTQLQSLYLGNNQLTAIPTWLGRLTQLQSLYLTSSQLTAIPESLERLTQLKVLDFSSNQLTSLPLWLASLSSLQKLDLERNPLNPELEAACREGLDAVKRFLQAEAQSQIALNEAKLILIGEGEVGKSCLLAALRGDPWDGCRPATHGIEIKPVHVTDPDGGTAITLNGWDFGGQTIYRPTHQLFFSAPAVYLVVWKPREGTQQGLVTEWIKLVKHREPTAKILVVATHGGPKERQPDIDRQELWDLFGKETVLGFHHVDSQPPDEDLTTRKRTGPCSGIQELKTAIARVAASLPETRRNVPQTWHRARNALKEANRPYMPLVKVLEICKDSGLDMAFGRDFVAISHRLGFLIHYGHDPALRDVVVLKPDWLATAISLVLDDKETRANSGLVNDSRLAQIWNDPERPAENRYQSDCFPIFRSLMLRYDLCYEVADSTGVILVAQLVPDLRPTEKLAKAWPSKPIDGDVQQTQICKILDDKHQAATAEGVFFWLMVRLHKYSLGRAKYADSVHWKRGVVLQDTYGSQALLEHIDNDIRITVRSPYPERFLSALTYEVQWLVETFWKNLRCSVTVPCLNPKGQGPPCLGLFEVGQLLDDRRQSEKRRPCPICNNWQNIEDLLHNAPAARPDPLQELILTELVDFRDELKALAKQENFRHEIVIGRLDQVETAANVRVKEVLSKMEATYDSLIRTIVDDAKEGPRLFSFEALEPGFWDRPKWTSTKYRITLWCEHSRLPLPMLNGEGDNRGVYEVTVPRDWVIKAAPFLKALSTTLSLVLPIASSALKIAIDSTTYKGIEKELGLGEKCADGVLKAADKVGEWLGKDDTPEVAPQKFVKARGAELRQLQVWLKERDPSYGGLVRVQNRRHEFLWVHPQYEQEYAG